MNSGQIRMTPELMHIRAGEYRKEAEEVRDVLRRMDEKLLELMNEWEGKSSEAYKRRFDELRPYFVDASELIDQIAFSLDRAADIVEATDAEIAGGL